MHEGNASQGADWTGHPLKPDTPAKEVAQNVYTKIQGWFCGSQERVVVSHLCTLFDKNNEPGGFAPYQKGAAFAALHDLAHTDYRNRFEFDRSAVSGCLDMTSEGFGRVEFRFSRFDCLEVQEDLGAGPSDADRFSDRRDYSETFCEGMLGESSPRFVPEEIFHGY